MVFLPGSDYGYTVLPRDTKVIREACCEEEEGGTSGGPFIIAHKLAQAAFHVMKHQVEYKEELLFRFSKEYAAREGGETLRIGGRLTWSLLRLGAVFPIGREYIG